MRQALRGESGANVKQTIIENGPWAGIVLILLSGMGYLMCAAHQAPEKISIRALAENQRIDIDELTPVELMRMETLLNQEASPCGDNRSLAQSLVNPGECPLTAAAVNYMMSLVTQDYDISEISARYEARYAALQGLDIAVDHSPALGPANPQVRIVVFSDFECPHCSRMADALSRLAHSYPEHIQLVFKHYPLPEIHPSSELAARAAYAAHRQDKFWEMHDLLFSLHSGGIDPDRLRVMAIGLGLDPDEFEDRLASEGALAAIAADKAQGVRLGVTGTPAVFINGRPFEGGVSALEARVQEEFLRHAWLRPATGAQP